MRRQPCHSQCIFATRKISGQMICSSEGSCHGNWWLSDRKWWPKCRSGWYKVIGVRNVLQKSSYRSCFVLLSKANACISYCWFLTISWFPQTQSAPVKAESNNAIPSLGTSQNRRLFLHFELWRPPFPSRCQSHSVSPRIPSLKIELQSPIGTPSREPFLSPAKAGRKERGRVTYLFGLRPCLHWVRTTMRRETWPSRVYANCTPSVHGVIWKFISKKCLTAA